MSARRRCERCAYAEPVDPDRLDDDDEETLTCRRLPPQWRPRFLNAQWPTVKPDDWCGEFASKSSPPGAVYVWKPEDAEGDR